eukprot:TRINITY_DN657_c0_g1_i1.p1 TRINITY_DN657_c0_g1~~TRINITY_DN657_c0_g1_i1.p1  ORF type:complete len:943 (+),score=549.71 TRINITY_DN657_c0_g1_i1:21-2849(+)
MSTLGGTSLGGSVNPAKTLAKKKVVKKKTEAPSPSSAEQPAEPTSTTTTTSESSSSAAPTPSPSETPAAAPAGVSLGGPPPAAAAGVSLGGPPAGSSLGGGPAAIPPKKKVVKKGTKAAAAAAPADGSAPAAGAAPAATAAAAAPKKKISKAAQIILKQREAQEKLIRAAEEKERREEAQRRREEEEAARLKEIQDAERKKKDAAAKERKAQEAKIEAQRRAFARLGIQTDEKGNRIGPLVKVVTKQEKKERIAQDQARAAAKAAAAQAAAEAAAAAKAEEDVPSSWDDLDVDDEEDLEDVLSSTPAPSSSSSSSSSSTVQTAAAAASEYVAESTPVSSKNADGSEKELRSPICCVLGHVDAGKTKLLDKIRKTNVQDKEAGGITQQIGATYFPLDHIKEMTKRLQSSIEMDYKVPGLLIIDTPGHESFSNLRSRGSSLCNIAILVVDMMEGLKPQTRESIQLLRSRKTPFVVALNKVDRIFNWKPNINSPIEDSLSKQPNDAKLRYEEKATEIITELAMEGLNAALYYKNPNIRQYVSIVPTSAATGEGIPDLLMLLITLTQKLLSSKFVFISEKVECTVLEVKKVDGLGTTIDVILTNGVLHEGDRVVLCGLNGPVVTSIKSLLTPHPMREIRVKSPYIRHKEIKAAQGIKIVAHDLDQVVAGSQLIVVRDTDDIEEIKDEVQSDFDSILTRYKSEGSSVGVHVQASTLGSLEALLDFLQSEKIPVAGVNIGTINKKDIIKASVMTERDPYYAVILAFDVKTSPEAQREADRAGVRIFSADIIYHLKDQFLAYVNSRREEERAAAQAECVWPCVLEILPEHIYNKRSPLIFGVRVIEGQLHMNTPVCVTTQNDIYLGKVTSIEQDHKSIEVAKTGVEACIRIESNSDTTYLYGRHFSHEDELASKITRKSLDVLKELHGKDLSDDDKILLLKLKNHYAFR